MPKKVTKRKRPPTPDLSGVEITELETSGDQPCSEGYLCAQCKEFLRLMKDDDDAEQLPDDPREPLSRMRG
jgi:hypothetical protein